MTYISQRKRTHFSFFIFSLVDKFIVVFSERVACLYSHKRLSHNTVYNIEARNYRVAKMSRKRRYKRGFPVALLVGFEEDHVVFWQIFSRVVKPSLRLKINGKRTDEKVLYNFHESVVDAIKPVLTEGIRSVVITAPARKAFAADFLDHVRKHHKYLIRSNGLNRANFSELVGSADDRIKVAELVKTKEFTNLIEETTSEEADHLINNLEEHLYGADNNSIVLYTLKEIEDTIYNLEKGREFRAEYLLLTDKYLTDSKQKNRINRLLQISKNKKVKTRVIKAKTAAGNRISQFGGIVFFSTTIR